MSTKVKQNLKWSVKFNESTCMVTSRGAFPARPLPKNSVFVNQLFEIIQKVSNGKSYFSNGNKKI